MTQMVDEQLHWHRTTIGPDDLDNKHKVGPVAAGIRADPAENGNGSRITMFRQSRSLTFNNPALRSARIPSQLHNIRFNSTTSSSSKSPNLVRNGLIAATLIGAAAVNHFYPELVGLGGAADGGIVAGGGEKKKGDPGGGAL